MHARVSYFQKHTGDIDAAARVGEEKLVPQLQTVSGFQGMQLLVDRETGRSIAITYWEDEESLRASEQQADRVREEAGELAGFRAEKVERYEVVSHVDA